MALPPSEFGGSDTSFRHGIQPIPHTPTASEKLRLLYQTGSETGNPEFQDTEGAAFAGLLPYEVQRAIREAEGVFEKGQAWEETLASVREEEGLK